MPARVAMHWRKGRRARLPVFVAGLFSSAAGVGRSARLFADALQGAGVDVRRIDVGPALGHRRELSAASDSADGEGVLVSHLNPPELRRWLAGPGARALRGKRHVGMWFWELAEAPVEWRNSFSLVDEVWCQSRFTAKAVAAIAPTGMRVSVLPHPVFAIGSPQPDRLGFGIQDGACAVLVSADLRSTSARKNPEGAVEAFSRACPVPDPDRALLLCRIRGLDAEPDTARRLITQCGGRSDIRLLTDTLSTERMLQLLASVDVVFSAHRSEGFGLAPAEGLWLGKAVVATGWSGVMDFLDEESASLVRWRPIPVSDAQGVYRGGEWAEPDLDDAAARLRRLIDDPQLRAELGGKAGKRARQCFDRNVWLDQVAELLGVSFGAAT